MLSFCFVFYFYFVCFVVVKYALHDSQTTNESKSQSLMKQWFFFNQMFVFLSKQKQNKCEIVYFMQANIKQTNECTLGNFGKCFFSIFFKINTEVPCIQHLFFFFVVQTIL